MQPHGGRVAPPGGDGTADLRAALELLQSVCAEPAPAPRQAAGHVDPAAEELAELREEVRSLRRAQHRSAARRRRRPRPAPPALGQQAAARPPWEQRAPAAADPPVAPAPGGVASPQHAAAVARWASRSSGSPLCGPPSAPALPAARSPRGAPPPPDLGAEVAAVESRLRALRATAAAVRSPGGSCGEASRPMLGSPHVGVHSLPPAAYSPLRRRPLVSPGSPHCPAAPPAAAPALPPRQWEQPPPRRPEQVQQPSQWEHVPPRAPGGGTTPRGRGASGPVAQQFDTDGLWRLRARRPLGARPRPRGERVQAPSISPRRPAPRLNGTIGAPAPAATRHTAREWRPGHTYTHC
eukprot:TRINITY_DN2459_c5_g1_i3.p2 TRINITY_DN2459_c5_g1~~TRINITY_DN2459_c5_g1_i3.p2  ORF type:complete len:374 (+),score=79.87 TRINITY_DN2459_c5_g1_i3:67-1122(+)